MKPYYSDDLVTIYHSDWRDVVAGLEADVVVTDPPYGMGWDTDSSRFSGGQPSSVRRRGRGRTDWGAVKGDHEPFDPTPWMAYRRAVLWGSNHYANRLPVGTTLVWLKRMDGGFGSFLSDAEVAWMTGGHGVYVRRDTTLMSHTGVRYHPTQKPVGIMRWSIEMAGGAGTVLDPFMGSGSTLVAAKLIGRPTIGIEVEERWCEAAANRCRQEVLGLETGEEPAA